MTTNTDQSQTTASYDAPLSYFERGIVQKTIGGPADVESLDDDEAAEYMRGYNNAR